MVTDFLKYSGILRKGDVVLDIGANIGYYALLESMLVGETGLVYAVEPVISNFKQLEKNIQLNNAGNIRSFQFAFGAEKAETEIYISDKCNWCTLNKEAIRDCVGSQKVSVVPVDSFLEDKATPKLIRMDVEGYEYEVLQGMTNTLDGPYCTLPFRTIFISLPTDSFKAMFCSLRAIILSSCSCFN